MQSTSSDPSESENGASSSTKPYVPSEALSYLRQIRYLWTGANLGVPHFARMFQEQFIAPFLLPKLESRPLVMLLES